MANIPAVPAPTEPVSFTPSTVQPEINFDQINPQTAAPDVAADRAIKYDFALGDGSPGIDQITANLTAGSDKPLRDAMTAQLDLADSNHRTSIIQQIAQSRQGPISQEEMDVIRGMRPDPQGRSPDAILEQEYGRKFWNQVLTTSTMMDPLLHEAVKKNEDYQFWLTDQASDIKAKQESTLRIAQDAQERYKKEGWLTTLGNQALSWLVPGYSTYNAQRTLPDIPAAGYYPGSVLAQKLQSLHLMNPAQYDKTLTAEFNRLYEANPTQAMEFIKKVQEYNSSDAFYDDAFSLMDLAGLGMAVPGKAAGAVKAGARAMTQAELETARTGTKLLTGGPLISQDKLLAAKLGTQQVVAGAREAQTVRVPRSMNQAELVRANTGINGYPAPQSYTPDAIKAMGEKLAEAPSGFSEVTTPRYMSIRELEQAKQGPDGRFFTPDELDEMGVRLRTARAYIDILKASSGPKPDVVKALAGAGDIGPAAILNSAKEVVQNMAGKDGITDFSERAQSILNPVSRMDNATSLVAEQTKRLGLNWTQNAKMLMDAITEPVLVRRTPDIALVKGLQETEIKMRDLYKGPADSIMDIRWNLARAPEAIGNFAPKQLGKNLSITGNQNLNSVSFILGRRNGTLFESAANAKFTADLQYRLGKDAYEIIPQGGGYALKVDKVVDETSAGVRDLLVQTETQTPKSWVNMFLGMMRSSKDVTSLLNSESRNLVTHGSQAVQNVMAEIAKSIGVLNRDEYKNMKRFFELDRDWHGPDQIPGRFLNTVGEFETEYANAFKRPPTDKETNAYFSYRQLNDFDWLVRNLGFYRDLSRQGVENVRFKFTNKEGEKAFSDYFMAKEVKSLPLSHTDTPSGIHVVDTVTGKSKTYRSTKLDAGQIADFKKKIAEEGYKVYQIANPIDRPLREIAGVNDYVNFVLVKDSNTKGLNWDMIPYHPGGHREYATSWFVKQANIAKLGGRMNYEGDRTLLGQYSEAETQRYAAALNKAREMYLTKDAGFDAHVAGNLPAEWSPKVVRKMFASRGWDVNEPFHSMYTGQTVKDIDALGLKTRYANGLHDEINSNYNLFANVDKKFVGSRDPSLKTIRDGTEANPQLSLAEAPVIDPLRSLNRTVSNVVHQRMISDYKWQSVEAFIANHAKVLDVSQDTLRQNPVYWTLNAPLKFAPGADASAVAAAKADAAAIKSFLSMDSPDVRAVKWMQMKALDAVYNKLGQGVSNYVAEHLLSTVSDPFKYARALAFHTKMGMYNPVQILNQLQTLTHVTALAGPKVASQAIMGATLMNMLRLTENPAVIDHFAEIAAKWGYTKESFLHAREQLKRSGWDLIQGETSWRDDVADPNMFKSTWGKFLDAGTVFFKEGERMTRLAAWNAAYLEHTKGMPIRQFNDQTLQKILSRADLMNVNMTRASQSPLQQGIVGTATQFLTYQARLFEQLWGGRLTQAEKARVLATYTAMYGVPTTTGIAVGAWPMYDSIRTSALEKGQDWDNSSTKVLMEGLPSVLISMATGKDTNYSERFGPQGISSLSDVIHGEKSWWELLTGVSGSTMKDVSKAMAPVLSSMWEAVQGKSDEFPFVVDDLTDAAKTITTFNNTYKAIWMANYGKELTKSGTVINDADKIDAVLTGAFGLTRRASADMYRMIASQKTLQGAQDAAQKLVVSEMRRAAESASQNDEESSRRHLARAQQYFKMGDIQPQRWGEIMKQVGSPGNVIDKVRFDFFFKKAPPSEASDRIKQLGVQ